MADKKENELGAVFHRKDRCEWLVTMTLDEWMKLYKGSGLNEETELNGIKRV